MHERRVGVFPASCQIIQPRPPPPPIFHFDVPLLWFQGMLIVAFSTDRNTSPPPGFHFKKRGGMH